MLGGISIWQLLIILAIVILIFGTKKFKNIGGDLGNAVKGFKNAMKEGEQEAQQEKNNLAKDKSEPIDVQAKTVDQEKERN